MWLTTMEIKTNLTINSHMIQHVLADVRTQSPCRTYSWCPPLFLVLFWQFSYFLKLFTITFGSSSGRSDPLSVAGHNPIENVLINLYETILERFTQQLQHGVVLYYWFARNYSSQRGFVLCRDNKKWWFSSWRVDFWKKNVDKSANSFFVITTSTGAGSSSLNEILPFHP